MITLTINCETNNEARIYLNALEYHGLIHDLYQALRSAEKHGTEADVLKVLESFKPYMYTAIDNHEGAY
jgi:hypothetical protein